MHGNTGDIGIVPDVGSQPKSGYHAERLIACRTSALDTEKLFPVTNMPPRSSEAPELESATSCRKLCKTNEIIPAVLGVAKDVPEVS